MAAYAILHTTTRVIRRLTTEDPPLTASDETAVAVDPQPDLSQGYLVLEVGGTVRAATEPEIVAARVDPVRERARRLALRTAMLTELDALCTGIDGASNLASLRALIKRWVVALQTLYLD